MSARINRMRKNDIEFPLIFRCGRAETESSFLSLDAFHSPFDNLLKNWEKTAFHYVAATDSFYENLKNLLLTGRLAGSLSTTARLWAPSCAILSLHPVDQ